MPRYGPPGDPAWAEALAPPSELRRLAVRPEGVVAVAAGRSMEPTLHVGDRVRIRSAARVRTGDVVLFETAEADACIMHRVILHAPGLPWFVHAGDAWPGDPAVAPVARIVGRADELPRRRPTLGQRAAAVAVLAAAIARSLGRRLRPR